MLQCMQYMEHPTTVRLYQDTVFTIGKFLKQRLNCNTHKKNGTLLWWNPKINNRYIDGSDLIYIFRCFNYGYKLIGSSVKSVKE